MKFYLIGALLPFWDFKKKPSPLSNWWKLELTCNSWNFKKIEHSTMHCWASFAPSKNFELGLPNHSIYQKVLWPENFLSHTPTHFELWGVKVLGPIFYLNNWKCYKYLYETKMKDNYMNMLLEGEKFDFLFNFLEKLMN